MNIVNVKPIETHYNGYRFRSRLEARWAVFFDAIGLKYEYEHEGYRLDDNTFYLPDFYMHRVVKDEVFGYRREYHSFIEIKAKEPTPEEIRKAKLLCNSLDAGLYFFWGLPCTNLGLHICPDEDDCGIQRVTMWSYEDGKGPILESSPVDYWDEYNKDGWTMCLKHPPYIIFPRANANVLINGINRAKSARFEFGEVPA